jgi:hypothetical protein
MHRAAHFKGATRTQTKALQFDVERLMLEDVGLVEWLK